MRSWHGGRAVTGGESQAHLRSWHGGRTVTSGEPGVLVSPGYSRGLICARGAVDVLSRAVSLSESTGRYI